MLTPDAAVTASVIGDPRVERRVEHIHQQVDDDEARGTQEQHALHHGVVARQDALDDQPPDTRKREDLLGQ